MKTKHIVSYGAGIDSTAMIFLLLEKRKPIDYVVFADTGAELPETYSTVRKMRNYLKKLGIPLITVKPVKERSLEDRCRDRNVIPDRIRRWCTRDVKITPIFKFYRTLDSKIVQYIGIDATEKRRMREDPNDWISNSYPLVQYNITREDCIEIIKKAKFPLPIKSGCYFCIYNNIERLFWLYTYHKDLWKKAREFEEQSKHYPNQTLFPTMTLKDIEKSFSRGIIPSTPKQYREKP